MTDVRCPFCGDDGFDLIGLKHHLFAYCDEFEKTLTLEQELAEKRRLEALAR